MRTRSMSAPTRSAMLANSFMNEILVASIALAAYLVNSAEAMSIENIFSRFRLNGAYSRRSCDSDCGSSTPMTMRSGAMKSLTAAPSLRNSGFEATRGVNPALPASAIVSIIEARTFSAVPTGTVDLVTTSCDSVSSRPMVRATESTARRSAEPSMSEGVPTAMNRISPCRVVSAASVEKCSRPVSALRCTSPSRPGSKIGISPRFRASTLSWSMSMQTTSLPTSARQAPVTRPT